MHHCVFYSGGFPVFRLKQGNGIGKTGEKGGGGKLQSDGGQFIRLLSYMELKVVGICRG